MDAPGSKDGTSADGGTDAASGALIIKGVVTDVITGLPLSGVKASGTQGSVTTDADGKYQLTIARAMDWVVTLEKDGYALSYARGSTAKLPDDGAELTADSQLKAVGKTGTISSTVGGNVTLANAAKVEFAANTFTKADGSMATGMVKVELTHVNPLDQQELQAFPGDFTATLKNGTTAQLNSLSLVDITARLDGETLTIAAGKTATVTFPIANPGDAPDVIPLWSLDPKTGTWIEEGRATKVTVDGKPMYQAQITHLSWWNCDGASRTVEITGSVTYNGQPVVLTKDAPLTLRGRAQSVAWQDTEEQPGSADFRLRIPGDTVVTIVATWQGRFSAPVIINPSDTAGKSTYDVGKLALLDPTGATLKCPSDQRACNGGCLDQFLPCGTVAPDRYCTVDNGGCPDEVACTATGGTVGCGACPTGTRRSGKQCLDIDECAEDRYRDLCYESGTCVNTVRAYRCDCSAGTYNVSATRCSYSYYGDTSRCGYESPRTCPANAHCANHGTKTCACNPGFTGDGNTCTAVDECATNNGGCDTNATCSDGGKLGDRVCKCRAGYVGDGFACRMDPICLTNNGGCDARAACLAAGEGKTICTCPRGYAGDGKTCTDVDECTLNNGECGANSRCTNTPGGRTCACAEGFVASGSLCIADPCKTNNGGCDTNATCVGTTGRAVCTCKTGFTGNGTTCADVNECATNNGDCDTNATCTNINGGNTCTCNTGFTGNGTICADVNECATNNGGCHTNATCTNTPGGRGCACKAGYQGDGVTCTDVNECAAKPCLNGGACSDGINSFTCQCSGVYTGPTCANVAADFSSVTGTDVVAFGGEGTVRAIEFQISSTVKVSSIEVNGLPPGSAATAILWHKVGAVDLQQTDTFALGSQFLASGSSTTPTTFNFSTPMVLTPGTHSFVISVADETQSGGWSMLQLDNSGQFLDAGGITFSSVWGWHGDVNRTTDVASSVWMYDATYFWIPQITMMISP